jgi:hypothetical protein
MTPAVPVVLIVVAVAVLGLAAGLVAVIFLFGRKE